MIEGRKGGEESSSSVTGKQASELTNTGNPGFGSRWGCLWPA